MKLKLHMDDYVTAMGGVALLRLQEWACRNLPQWRNVRDLERPIQTKEDYVEVDSAVLEHLPEWYFKYLMDAYSVKEREKDKFKNIMNFQYQSPKDQINRLKDSINANLKKLTKYFPEHPQLSQLHTVLEEVKLLKPEQAEQELERLRDRYVELLSINEFEEKLTLNIIRSVMSSQFFGQTSMLQKTRSHFTLQQHIDQMKQDFVQPVLMDIELLNWIVSNPDPDEQSKNQLVELLANSNRYRSKEWASPIKKLKPDQIHEFLSSKLRCSFEEEWFATIYFEEMTFAPLGVSGSYANFQWNLEQHPMPISSWIRLIMFLAPVGLTRFTRLYKDDFETYYSFIYRDGTPRTIYEDNNALENMEHNESFERLIPKLVERQVFKAKREVQPNIQIIEFYSDIEKRKTIMNYYHVPRHMIVYFTNGLSRIHFMHRSLRDPFLQLVMESVDPIHSVWTYLQKTIRGKANPLSAYWAFRERFIIQILKQKEGLSVSTEELKKKANYIYHVAQEGVKIRQGLERRADRQSESTDYVSSGGKRAAGIAHRLLNAAKAGNKQQFLDTTLRLYLTVGEPVPTSLLNVLHEEKIDFASWSGAFITGLLGGEPSNSSDPDSVSEDNDNKMIEGGSPQ